MKIKKKLTASPNWAYKHWSHCNNNKAIESHANESIKSGNKKNISTEFVKNEINKKEKEKLQEYLLGLSAGVGPCDAAGARRQKKVGVREKGKRERISNFW